MRVLLSYPYTGEDKDFIARMLVSVRDVLVDRGIEPVCLYFDHAVDSAERQTPRAAMDAAFLSIDDVDAVLVLQSSSRRSEGMLMEVGYARAKQTPVIVAAHVSAAPSYLPTMATQSFQWSTIEELATQLAAANIPQMLVTNRR